MQPGMSKRPSEPAFAEPLPAPAGALRDGRPRLALVIDPRFSGGSSSAVAAEIRALRAHTDLSVFAIETAMFKGRAVNPALQATLEESGLELIWDAPVIRADTVILHNPSCLRFDAHFPARISCRACVVVTHENFLRPGGSEGFDVGRCLALIDGALVCGQRRLAPVSSYNRRTVAEWLARTASAWTLTPFDWSNVCDFPLRPPNPQPRDRRGRHSRPGLEKFPPPATMLRHFPPHAERCAILGGDGFLAPGEAPPAHWTLWRFGEMDVARFLEEIDFFVYFTHPRWRESFGRVIAEAIAAGKLVITDPGTAEAFPGAVVASSGEDVDAIVAGFVADPEGYVAFVRAAQAVLARFAPEAFAARVLPAIAPPETEAHAPR